jgi:hypothetical protein
METTGLIDTLKKETESLRIQYIEMTQVWAVKDFNALVKFATDYNGGKFLIVNARGRSENDSQASKKYHGLPHHVSCRQSLVMQGQDPVQIHIDRAVAMAERHYAQSIEKLAIRITKKGLAQWNLRVGTSHIGVNIETILTDGIKTVRAWTIVASGQIQRPHYRYLIK